MNRFIPILLICAGCSIPTELVKQTAQRNLMPPMPIVEQLVLPPVTNVTFFAWDYPDTNNVTFDFYYGPQHRIYTNVVNVGTNRQYSFTNYSGQFVAVTAVNQIGVQSFYSLEWPQIPPDRITMTATGPIHTTTNFLSWKVFSTTNPITVIMDQRMVFFRATNLNAVYWNPKNND